MNGGEGGSLRLSDSKRMVSKATAKGALSGLDSSGHLRDSVCGLGIKYLVCMLLTVAQSSESHRKNSRPRRYSSP